MVLTHRYRLEAAEELVLLVIFPPKNIIYFFIFFQKTQCFKWIGVPLSSLLPCLWAQRTRWQSSSTHQCRVCFNLSSLMLLWSEPHVFTASDPDRQVHIMGQVFNLLAFEKKSNVSLGTEICVSVEETLVLSRPAQAVCLLTLIQAYKPKKEDLFLHLSAYGEVCQIADLQTLWKWVWKKKVRRAASIFPP